MGQSVTKTMKQYYEAHVTMLGDPDELASIVEDIGWKFSAIDGDADLGDGVKCYATRQFNARKGEQNTVAALLEAAIHLQNLGATVLRRKVELVVFDDRSKEAREQCDGACPECVG